MLAAYFKSLYQRTMSEAYSRAIEEITNVLRNGGRVLDCGANNGKMFATLKQRIPLSPDQYFGIEWDQRLTTEAQGKGLQVIQADLNKKIPYEENTFTCVFALSVLEHLLNGCRFMKESHRVLAKNGTLVLLTPNISTFFTAALILLGKMPSSGPHPDSDVLVKKRRIIQSKS